MEAATPDRRKRPWWHWALLAFVGLLILGAVVGEEDASDETAQPVGPSGATATTPVGTTPTETATETATTPTQTIEDAREAVDDDRYADALAIAAALTAAELNSIRRRISNRYARRAVAAVRSGDRARARFLLQQAEAYPTTQQLTQARSSLKASQARATARREAAEARRRAEAARRRQQEEAQRVEREPSGDCAPGYSPCVPAFPPDVDCGDVSGPIQVTGSDPHGLDRDGDGVGCEG